MDPADYPCVNPGPVTAGGEKRADSVNFTKAIQIRAIKIQTCGVARQDWNRSINNLIFKVFEMYANSR